MKNIKFKNTEVVWFDAEPDANVYDVLKEVKEFINTNDVYGCFLEQNSYLFYIEKNTSLTNLINDYSNYLITKNFKNYEKSKC